MRTSIFNIPDKAPSRELEKEWHEGRMWRRQCQHCGQYASKGRDVNELCEFCGYGVVLWVSKGIGEFIVEEDV